MSGPQKASPGNPDVNFWCLAMKVWVVKLLGGPSVWERQSSPMAGASAVHWGTPGSSLVGGLLEDGQAAWRSALFRDLALLGTKCSSKGLPTEVQSVLFGREAAWRLRYQCCVLTALQVMLNKVGYKHVLPASHPKQLFQGS